MLKILYILWKRYTILILEDHNISLPSSRKQWYNIQCDYQSLLDVMPCYISVHFAQSSAAPPCRSESCEDTKTVAALGAST